MTADLELPDGWRLVRLGDVCLPTPRRSPRKEGPGAFLYVDIDAVDNRRQEIISPKCIQNGEAPSRARHEIRSGDVIFSLVRPYLRNIAIVPRDCDRQIASSAFCVLRPGRELTTGFLFHLVSSAPFIASIPTYGHSPPAGRDDELLNVRIPLPPVHEQRRIVDVIEAGFALLDVAEAALRKARLRLDVYLRRRIEVLVDHQGDRQWPTVALGEIASIGTGSTPLRTRSDYWVNGAVPWVTSGQLNDDFVAVPAAHVTDLAVAESRLKLWPRHTLLVAMYGEGRTRGKCSELLIEATTNQACAAISLKADAPVRREFLKLLLQSRYESHRKMASGGVQPNLNLGIVRGWRIPVPSLNEQDEIAQEMAASSSVLAEVQQTVKASIARAAVLRRRVVSAKIPSTAAS